KRRRDGPCEAARTRCARGGEPVGERALADDRRDGAKVAHSTFSATSYLVASGGLDDVPAAERGAPQRDAVAVDPVETASVGKGGGPVAELALDVEQLARLAAAVAEVPVGEDQRGDAGIREAAREGLQAVLARRPQAVAEDHERRMLG